MRRTARVNFGGFVFLYRCIQDNLQNSKTFQQQRQQNANIWKNKKHKLLKPDCIQCIFTCLQEAFFSCGLFVTLGCISLISSVASSISSDFSVSSSSKLLELDRLFSSPTVTANEMRRCEKSGVTGQLLELQDRLLGFLNDS